MYMRNKLRLMMVITFVILSMSIFYYQISINGLKDFKYKISTPYNGHSKSTYYTNSYTEKASMFVTSTLDENALKKMFGEPILHSEFGEGFDGEYDEETDDFLEPGIKESYASYFVNVGGSDFHIGYDHRGTRIEIGLSKPFSYERKPSDQLAESCLQSLKDLFDLYKKKFL